MPKRYFDDTRLAAIFISIWLVASIFGDELFALIFFRDVDAAFGFSMGELWWWIYQVVIAGIFFLGFLAVSKALHL